MDRSSPRYLGYKTQPPKTERGTSHATEIDERQQVPLEIPPSRPRRSGLRLQPGGWVPVDDLLAAADRGGFPITFDELVECVETNDKQRFSFDVTGELIRANQGHSVEMDLQLEEREPPEILYHGTVGRFLASIMAQGLDKGTRHHVHLTIAVQALASRRGITEPIGAARSDGD
jgi:RNA:NAD 2'-phosphotransferase (TPT1/KptA family)